MFKRIILMFIFLTVPVFALAQEKEVKEGEPAINMQELVFCVDQGSFFFFEPGEGKIYRYGIRGDFTQAYKLIELGEDLEKGK